MACATDGRTSGEYFEVLDYFFRWVKLSESRCPLRELYESRATGIKPGIQFYLLPINRRIRQMQKGNATPEAKRQLHEHARRKRGSLHCTWDALYCMYLKKSTRKRQAEADQSFLLRSSVYLFSGAVQSAGKREKEGIAARTCACLVYNLRVRTSTMQKQAIFHGWVGLATNVHSLGKRNRKRYAARRSSARATR